MIINHNIPALNTYRQLTMNNASSSKSMEKLSSGLRINRAGDDAAGLAISEKMRGQIRGLNQASRNAQDSISLIQTAEGALQETHSILQRMRELSVQSANDTNTTVDRSEIQKEMNQLTSEINRIGNTTEFNTMKLLNGDRANTLGSTGTVFTNGGGAVTGTNLSVALDGNVLGTNNYTLDITKTNTKTAYTEATQVADVNYTMATATTNPTFDGGGITITDSNYLYSGDAIVGSGAHTTGTVTGLVSGGTINSGFSGSLEVTISGVTATIAFGGIASGVGSGIELIQSGLDATFGSGTATATLNGSGRLEISVTTSGVAIGSGMTGIMVVDGSGSGFEAFGMTSGHAYPTITGYSGASGATVIITKTASGLVVTNSGSGGITASGNSFRDVLVANASGVYVQSGHGLSFKITDLGSFATGDVMTLDMNKFMKSSNQGISGSTAATEMKVWSSVTLSSGSTNPTFSGGAIDVASGALTGTYSGRTSGGSLIISFTGSGSASGQAFVDIINPSVGGIFDYNNHGVSFKINANDLQSGELAFNVQDSYTVHAKLTNGSGVVLASGDIATNYHGEDSGTTITQAISGLTIAQSGRIYESSSSGYAFSVSGTVSGNDGTLTFQIGANQNQTMSLEINDMRSKSISVSANSGGTQTVALFNSFSGATSITAYYKSTAEVTNGTNNVAIEYALDVSDATKAAAAITVVNDAIERVSAERSKLGAYQNRLDHTINNLNTSAENLQAAESRVRDVDMARQMMDFTKNNILAQAAQSMLAQANQQPQGVLQLLR